MGWFSKTPRAGPAVQTDLGTFRFVQNGWTTDPVDGSLVILFSGLELQTAAIEAAAQLIQKLELFVVAGRDYARNHGLEVWDGKGELTPELLDITDLLQGKVGLTNGVSDNPDATVTVEFQDERPILLWAAD